MKYVSWGMTAIFVLWAYYQWNDPDATAWILVYLLAAIGSAAHARGKLPWGAAMGAGAFLSVWALDLFLQFEWVHPLLQIEEWREGMGLVIIVLWASVITVTDLRRQKKVTA